MSTPASAPWLRPLWRQLVSDRQQQRFAHAHLIPWQPDAASDRLIKNLADWLLCNANTSKACGECKACLLVRSGHHPDLTELGTLEDRSIGVDVIRQLIDKLSGTANQAGNKVAIIRYADRMTVNAQNALLKTLEEPTNNTFLILAPERSQALLPTLRSRLQQHKLPRLGVTELAQWLSQQTQQIISAEQPWLMRYTDRPLAALERLTTDQDGVAIRQQQL